MDIEEIHRYGKQEHYCPYYLNRIRAEKADIVLLPYNYIVDGRIRKRLKIDMRNDVLIIDEAHNISQVIEDASSFKIDTLTFIRALKELNMIKEKSQEKLDDKTLDKQLAYEVKVNLQSIEKLYQLTMKFLNFLEGYTMDTKVQGGIGDKNLNKLPDNSVVFPGGKIF